MWPKRAHVVFSWRTPPRRVFLPAADIPRFVALGSVSLGITGELCGRLNGQVEPEGPWLTPPTAMRHPQVKT